MTTKDNSETKDVPKEADHSEASSTSMKFSQDEQLFYKHLTLNIEEKLHRNRMIKDILLQVRQPVDKLSLSAWERKSGVHMPQDLKDFFLSTNGFKLTWSLEHAGDNLKIGEMNINMLCSFIALENMEPDNYMVTNSNRSTMDSRSKSANKSLGTSASSAASGAHSMNASTPKASQHQKRALNSSESVRSEDDVQNFQAYFAELRKTMEANDQIKSSGNCYGISVPQSTDKSFILDTNKYGWVCVVYQTQSNSSMQQTPRFTSDPASAVIVEPAVEIWFLDNSLQWHYLAPTFSHYYRMMLFHLGLPQWHYRFTPYGLSAWAEQMFWLVAPHLLVAPKLSNSNLGNSESNPASLWSSEVPSEAANPNPTFNILSNQLFRRKRRSDKEKPNSKTTSKD